MCALIAEPRRVYIRKDEQRTLIYSSRSHRSGKTSQCWVATTFEHIIRGSNEFIKHHTHSSFYNGHTVVSFFMIINGNGLPWAWVIAPILNKIRKKTSTVQSQAKPAYLFPVSTTPIREGMSSRARLIVPVLVFLLLCLLEESECGTSRQRTRHRRLFRGESEFGYF